MDPSGDPAVVFVDRTEAGRRLAQQLLHLRDENAVVLGLPRGGLPVAFEVARALGASRVILAVPVGPRDSIARLRDVADDVVCLETPVWFYAVGQHYRNFSQLSDGDVVDLLERAALGPPPTAIRAPSGVGGDPPAHQEEVTVSVGQIHVQGDLVLPEDAAG